MKLSVVLESLKGMPIDSLSKGILDSLHRIKDRISGSSILRYVSKEYALEENPIFIAFDTETTGLTHGIKKDKESGMTYPDYRQISKRDIIIELAAIAYDNNFHPVVFDEKIRDGDMPEEGAFHAKVQEKALKYKSNEYYMNSLKVFGVNPADVDKIETVYNKYRNGFKIDILKFQAELQNMMMIDEKRAEKISYLLHAHFSVKANKTMNKYEKDNFEKIHTKGNYKIHRYEEEYQLIKHFIDFAEKFKEHGTVYIVAQNLPYDSGMVESCLHYISKNGKGEEKAEAEQYLSKWDNLVSHSFDTKDLFAKVLNKNKVFDEIKSFFPEHGVKIIDMIKAMNPTYSKGSKNLYSLSLGNIAPKMMNKAWHTAMNDVFVMIDAMRYYASLIKLKNQIIRVVQGKKSNYILDRELIRYLRSSQ